MKLFNRGGWLCAAAISLVALSACAVAQPDAEGWAAPPGIAEAAAVADAVNVPAPATIADRTSLDETVAIGFETAATVAADLATLAVRTNVVPTSRLAELRERVAWARVAVGSVRAAYDTGNANSYRGAVLTATCAIGRVRSLATGAPDAVCSGSFK